MTPTTPFLINTHIGSFSEYLSVLSSNAKKHYSKAKNRNKDLIFEEIPYDKDLVLKFMRLWENQIVWGKKIQWEIKPQYLDYLNKKNQIRCFVAKDENTNEIICLQWIYYYGSYAYCAAPLHEKELYAKRNLAKYMWFKLIETAFADPEIQYLDFGAGGHTSWRGWMKIHSKNGYEGYKFQFVSRHLKENPDLAEDLVVRGSIFRNHLYLDQKKGKFQEYLFKIIWFVSLYLYRHKGQRFSKIISPFSKKKPALEKEGMTGNHLETSDPSTAKSSETQVI